MINIISQIIDSIKGLDFVWSATGDSIPGPPPNFRPILILNVIVVCSNSPKKPDEFLVETRLKMRRVLELICNHRACLRADSFSVRFSMQDYRKIYVSSSTINDLAKLADSSEDIFWEEVSSDDGLNLYLTTRRDS